MDDIVAIRVSDKKKGNVAFLTWGRVFDSTDPQPLKNAVASAVAKRFGLRDIVSIEICESLQDVTRHKYFFEALIAVSSKPIPYGRRTYKPWAAKMRREIKNGKALYSLGEATLGTLALGRPARKSNK